MAVLDFGCKRRLNSRRFGFLIGLLNLLFGLITLSDVLRILLEVVRSQTESARLARHREPSRRTQLLYRPGGLASSARPAVLPPKELRRARGYHGRTAQAVLEARWFV
jgi:hypothetical protein